MKPKIKMDNMSQLSDERLETIIVICRTIEGLKWLKQETVVGACDCYVVASDDIQVQTAARCIDTVKEVIFLELIETFYDVAPGVISILDAVNEWLSNFGGTDEIPKELLFWICHCEGGDTTQRIQDALLLVRSYLNMINLLHPSEIVIIRSLSSVTFEDDLLVACASHVGVKTRFIGNLGLRGLAKLFWERWRPLVKEVYLSSSIIYAWVRSASHHSPLLNPQKSVVVQLCDSAKKHLNQCIPLIAALDRAGLQGVALCWRAGKAASVLRKDGRSVVELETWVSLRTMLDSWRRAITTWHRASENIDDLLKENTGCPYDILVRKVLLKSMRVFFISEIAHRYRLYESSREFFSANPPIAARLWTRVLSEGVTAYLALPPDKRPLLFWQPSWDFRIPWPYARYSVPVDLIFALSEDHLNILIENEQIGREKIAFTSLPWLQQLTNFHKNYTKTESRNYLNMKTNFDLCLLLDTSYVCRGYFTAIEQILILTSVLDLIRDHPEIHLVIKPHRGHKTGTIEAVLSRYNLKNLTLIPKDDLPFHALNAADILITKMSTLTLEAMVLNVPTISVHLNGEKRFMCFEDAVDYVTSTSDLQTLIVKIMEDRFFREEWKEKKLTKMNNYLLNISSVLDEDPYDGIVDTLIQRLQCLN